MDVSEKNYTVDGFCALKRDTLQCHGDDDHV